MVKPIAFVWGSTAALVVPLYGLWNMARGAPGGVVGFGSERVSPVLLLIGTGMALMAWFSVKDQEPKKNLQ